MFVICSAVTFKVLPTRRLTKMVVTVVGIFVLKFLLLNSSPAFYTGAPSENIVQTHLK